MNWGHIVIYSCVCLFVLLSDHVDIDAADKKDVNVRSIPEGIKKVPLHTTVGIYRGSGSAQQLHNSKISNIPKSLTNFEKKVVLKQLGLNNNEPGAIYWSLSPAQPISSGKGVLGFIHPDYLSPDRNSAQFIPPKKHIDNNLYPLVQDFDPALAIWLYSEAAGKRYLVDCRVWVYRYPSQRFILTGPNHFKTTFSASKKTKVISFVVDSTDAGWYGFHLKLNHRWKTSGCDATRVN
jgi:hypothetical protein